MGKYELIYFPVRGLGESIRLLLTDLGIEFEETSVTTKETFVSEWKPKLKFGQLPLMRDGDLELVQSKAILRHLGRKHGLYGSNDQEAARIDELFDAVDDLRRLYIILIYKEYDTGKAEYIKNLPNQLKAFENCLKESNAADTGAAINGKNSIVDYNLFDVLENHTVLSPGCLDDFPCLKAFHSQMLARPKIAEYRQTEGFKTRKINGNDNQ